MDHKVYLPNEIVNIIISYIQPHPIAILINKYLVRYKVFLLTNYFEYKYVELYNAFFDFLKYSKYIY